MYNMNMNNKLKIVEISAVPGELKKVKLTHFL